MRISTDHNPDEDFGTLHITLEPDDSFHFSGGPGHGNSLTFDLPLYNWEAAALRESLSTLAQAESA